MKKTKTMTMIMIAMITMGVLAATIITSCTKSTPDPCASVTCYNGGVCAQGICNCATGYSGTYCQTKANTAFAGTWTGTNCLGGQVLSITTSSNPLQFTFPLQLNFTCGASTIINFTGFIQSGTQTFSTNTSTYYECGSSGAINASGSVSGNGITITLFFATSSGTSVCAFNGTK